MSHHLVLGAGGIGRATAIALVRRGHRVTLASRRGTDPAIPGTAVLALDAYDAAALTAAARDADAIVNAVNPASYVHWDRDWPPLAASILTAAERTGAVLVTVSNLYAYGRVSAPMTEETPLRPNGIKGEMRARMWRDALAAHSAGRIRATELRASDYFGPEAGTGISYLQTYVVGPALAGKRIARIPMGDPHAPHSWTYLPDIGELAAVLSTDERAWGQAWHVPTAQPRSMAQVAADVAVITGQPAPVVKRLPAALLLAARVSPLVRGLDETKHQFKGPFVLDSALAQSTFGLTSTNWEDALAATIRWSVEPRQRAARPDIGAAA